MLTVTSETLDAFEKQWMERLTEIELWAIVVASLERAAEEIGDLEKEVAA